MSTPGDFLPSPRILLAPWGRAIEPDAIDAALGGGRSKLVAIVHGETSTGVLQPLEEIARVARRHDALLLVDAVVTLGGSEVAAGVPMRSGSDPSDP